MRFRTILLTSLLLTILIFAVGILLNYGLDFVRIGIITDRMAEHELDREAYLIESGFSEASGSSCMRISSAISNLKEEIKEVGLDLGSYGKTSFFRKKDYDYLKRKYFLLELRFFLSIKKVNEECGESYIPILFFYEIDHELSERQGVILEDVGKSNDKAVILSIDKGYKDEPLVQLLVSKYSIKEAPAIVIDDVKKEGLMYEAEISSWIKSTLPRADPYGKHYDFWYVINAAGADKQAMINYLTESLEKNMPDFAKGDLMLVLGRLTKNNSLICRSVDYYSNFNTESAEELALLYETIASLDCYSSRKEMLLNASGLWRALGNEFRAEIDEKLAYPEALELKFDTLDIESNLSVPNDFDIIQIGTTTITLSNSDTILSQVDRVYRDWLGLQLEQSPFSGELLTTFSERLYLNESELLPSIGWHEGARIKEIKKIGARHITGTGTLAAKKNGKWYAVDDNGVFSFEVPVDKILYPTTRFLREDLAVLIDTHGVNMLVEQALRNNADAVVSDCDHPGKVKAAAYLSKRGIKVICYPDRYLSLALGHNLEAVGSPPLKIISGSAVFGNQIITLKANEKIVVMNAKEDKYALWYYQTPALYFKELEKYISLNAEYVTIDDFNQMASVVNRADEIKAKVIAVRVFNSDDYYKLKEWLDEDENNRAILFHSASYPYGYKILSEYQRQTTFGDVNLKFG